MHELAYNLKLQVRLPYPSLKSLPPINRSRKTQIPRGAVSRVLKREPRRTVSRRALLRTRRCAPIRGCAFRCGAQGDADERLAPQQHVKRHAPERDIAVSRKRDGRFAKIGVLPLIGRFSCRSTCDGMPVVCTISAALAAVQSWPYRRRKAGQPILQGCAARPAGRRSSG
jgi:hypothetical protein